MNVYEKCPTLENKSFLLRPIINDDLRDLLEVYSDKLALPFFNSDNCGGDNFYYATEEKMAEVLGFWDWSYKSRIFARLAIVDKASQKVVGTIELCLRASDDEFNGAGILRVDLRSDYEQEDALYSVLSLIMPHISELLGCDCVIIKVPIYAVERTKAVQRAGFTKTDRLLIGHDGYAYNGYWTMKMD